jgi:hypothetical protein
MICFFDIIIPQEISIFSKKLQQYKRDEVPKSYPNCYQSRVISWSSQEELVCGGQREPAPSTFTNA